MCCRGRWALFAGGARGDALCAALYAGGRGRGLCLLEVREVMQAMRRALLCILEAAEGMLCLLEVLEVPEVPEVMRCVVLCMLEVMRCVVLRKPVEDAHQFSGFEISIVAVFFTVRHRVSSNDFSFACVKVEGNRNAVKLHIRYQCRRRRTFIETADISYQMHSVHYRTMFLTCMFHL